MMLYLVIRSLGETNEPGAQDVRSQEPRHRWDDPAESADTSSVGTHRYR